MILAVDVHYGREAAVAGGVTFGDWSADRAEAVYRSTCREFAAYVPGQFFRRELPCILRLLGEHRLALEIIVIDGFVYLDGATKPGLGKYLFDALGGESPVIGVAKHRFVGAPDKIKVYRGRSRRPLYVTSVGMPLSAAKDRVAGMHGPYRIPTLLKQADQASRMIGR